MATKMIFQAKLELPLFGLIISIVSKSSYGRAMGPVPEFLSGFILFLYYINPIF